MDAFRLVSAQQSICIFVHFSLPRAPGPEIVAQAIVEALTASRPKFRYSVGPDSLLVPLGRRLLPEWACLKLIADHFKI